VERRYRAGIGCIHPGIPAARQDRSRPLLEEVNINVLAEDPIPEACIDRDHFVDLLTYILEDFVGSGAEDVEICTVPRQ
jgi:hypothetical protein